MKNPQEILYDAFEKYSPIKIALLFSGGHDSLVSTHVCSKILRLLDIPFIIYHGDTTIGIPETQQYVINVCDRYNWDLIIRKPPDPEKWYDCLVAKYGFPGPTKKSHQIMYRMLKERALNKFVTHECKSSPQAIENVLLVTGIRKSESLIRMGYTEEITKDKSKIWCSPIFWWSEQKCEDYMKKHSLPRNPVKDAICISGECLCGTFAGNEELSQIRAVYPDVAKRIDDLHETAKENGFPWGWSTGPTEWYKNHPPGQMDMFMCVGCEEKRTL